MDGIEPKIEIFKPFEEALELTKKILFQPFDLAKWCVIGFAAFLTYLNSGGFAGLRWPARGLNWTNHISNQRGGVRSVMDQLGPIWLIAIGVVILLLIAILVVLAWVRARGDFIFLDCIVRNRAAIVEPWNEYRVEGNSYFVFSLLLGLAVFGLIILLVALIIILALLGHHGGHGLVFVPILVFAVIFLLIIFFAMVIQFVAPIMYRRRCSAWLAFRDLLKLMSQYAGPFILYFLFSIVLGVAIAIGAIMVTCLTCCIAAIPYVGTVIMLPLFVFMRSFGLLFLRQFGPDYDVWQGIVQIEPASAISLSPPLVPPPIQS